MTAHAQIQPSSGGIWSNCPVAYQNWLKDREVAETDLMRRGTELHAILEELIRLGSYEPVQDGDVVFTGAGMLAIPPGYGEHMSHALVSFRPIAEAATEIYCEQRVDMQRYVPEDVKDTFFGTADLVTLTVRDGVLAEIGIFDYKSGKRRVPPTSTQNVCYVLGALTARGFITKSKETGQVYCIDPEHESVRVHMGILQPECCNPGESAISMQSFTLADFIRKFAQPLVDSIETMLGDVSAEKPIRGNHCQYCPGKSKGCEAWGVQKEAVIPDMAGLDTEKGVETLTDEELAAVVKSAKAIEDYLEAAKTETKARLLAGKDVPGVKLRDGRISRSWALDQEEMEKLFRASNIRPNEFRKPVEILSPAQAEKTWSKRRWAEMAQYVEEKVGKPSLMVTDK
ncbi:DUF2800 domain-containing protein [Thiolapillus sp.]|uniref:DUF2800 domain-containing protein n=1 Tax=Thiolapillus sp. TaxID=2017437 RepID=UPI0025F451CB|nr:DUF2800 domain-containing protein [Thiolapillus sp.]